MVQLGPEERERLTKTSLLQRPVPKESEQELASLKTVAFAKMEEKADKTCQQKRDRQEEILERPERTAKKSRAEEPQGSRWAGGLKPPQGKVDRPVPGVALVPTAQTTSKLQRLGFRVVLLGSDPQSGAVKFLQEAFKLESLRSVTHLVLCTDYVADNHALLGAAARLAGAFFCTEAAFAKCPMSPAGPTGVQFRTSLRRPREVFFARGFGPATFRAPGPFDGSICAPQLRRGNCGQFQTLEEEVPEVQDRPGTKEQTVASNASLVARWLAPEQRQRIPPPCLWNQRFF